MSVSKGYPRYITPSSQPFDPVELLKETEKIVIKDGPNGQERKYESIHVVGVYGGISTGYCIGCCFRCVFCWVSWARDFPERYGQFFTPEQVFDRLSQAAKKHRVSKLRISGAEPTLGKNHLLHLLKLVEESDYPTFVLETNGIPFGIDKDYVQKISKFTKPHVRVSLKAGTPEAFTRKTGAKSEAFEIPFKAIRNLLDYNVDFHVAAMSADPRIMTARERENLFKKLAEIDGSLLSGLEEEVMDDYKTTLARLKLAGWRVEWPLERIYTPIRDAMKKTE